MPHPGGPGGIHETLNAARFGVEENLLGSLQDCGQRLRTLQIGSRDLHLRRKARRLRIPARHPDLLSSGKQASGDMTAHASPGTEDDSDHCGNLPNPGPC